MRLRDKVAIISGSANGMGRAEAELFAREGAKVLVADVLEPEGQAVVAGIRAAGGTADFRRLDVGEEADWESAVATTVERHGRLDILVNNAGISGSVGDGDKERLDLYERLMRVNARGTFLGMKHAAAAMKKGGGGAIVNISSIAALAGLDLVHMGYGASKAASHLLTKSAAVQYAPHNIRVNSVHPGMMPAMLGTRARVAANPDQRTAMLALVPMGRAGRVEEVANAVLFLASDDASYITGTELVVDGGWMAKA